MRQLSFVIFILLFILNYTEQNTKTVDRAAILHTVADIPVADSKALETLSARDLFIQAVSFPVYGTVTEDSVRLRTAASLESNIITLLMKDQRVEILERTDEPVIVQEMADFWYKVKLKDGTTGWVFGSYVFIDELQFFMHVKKSDRGVYMDKRDFSAGDKVFVTRKNAPLYGSPAGKNSIQCAEWTKEYIVSEISDTVYLKGGDLTRFVKIKGNNAEGWIDTRFVSGHLLRLGHTYVFTREYMFWEKVYDRYGVFIYDDLACSSDGQTFDIEKCFSKEENNVQGFIIWNMKLKDMNNDGTAELIAGGHSFFGRMHSGLFFGSDAEEWMGIDENGLYQLFITYSGKEYFGEDIGGFHYREYEYVYDKETRFLYRIKERLMFEEDETGEKQIVYEKSFEWDGKKYSEK